jgi:anhydro-N-acetylmuramic acid kinase
MRVLGLISGTSFDAIEVAAADLTAGGEELTLRPLGALSVPYAPDLVRAIAAALPSAATTAQAICSLDTRIGQAFAEAADRGVHELAGGRADLVVSHGQTLYHRVEDGHVLGTLQAGQPAWIAESGLVSSSAGRAGGAREVSPHARGGTYGTTPQREMDTACRYRAR